MDFMNLVKEDPEDISINEINNFQIALIIGCLIGMGGQRRQVIADFMTDSIYYDEETDEYLAKLRVEKTIRKSNIEGLVIPKEIGFPLLLWQNNYRMYANPYKRTVGLWINRNGNCMESSTISKKVKQYCKTVFGNDKNITPIVFRRVMISIIFKNNLVKPDQNIQDFVNDLSIYLNTSPTIMEKHYNRIIDRTRNSTTMQVVHDEILNENGINHYRNSIGELEVEYRQLSNTNNVMENISDNISENDESFDESSDESSDESFDENFNENFNESFNNNFDENSDKNINNISIENSNYTSDDEDGVVIVTGKGINKRILSASSLKLEIEAIQEDLLMMKKIYRRKKQKLNILLKKSL